jgi:CBS domain-containing protein
MDVRDGMNRVVVTVGPDHTLRDAARRMTEGQVGAAVVLDPDGEGPGIITERDLLHACGRGQDLDREHVGDHMAQRLEYAAAEWPLEKAAEEMVRGRFRHVVVLDGSEVVGILSMRDIVRCWTEARALRRHASKARENSMGQGATV